MRHWIEGLPFRLGTTSYIIPDDILPNVRYLAGKVKDIELVLFDIDEYCNIPDAEQLSELIVFTRTLSDEERVAVTRYLQQKWFHEEDENEQFIGQNASFWLDAAERTTLAVNGSGQVTSWVSRVGSNYARQSSRIRRNSLQARPNGARR